MEGRIGIHVQMPMWITATQKMLVKNGCTMYRTKIGNKVILIDVYRGQRETNYS